MHRELLPILGLFLLFGLGCPLEHLKKHGFLDRAHAKDIRLTRQSEPCGEGERPVAPEECDTVRREFGYTDCQRACLKVK